MPEIGSSLLSVLSARLGKKGFTIEPGEISPWLTDWRGRWRGSAQAMVSPASTDEVAFIVGLCAEAGVPIVPQGGNTSMVGGATPDESGAALLLSLRRMNLVRSLDTEENLAVVEAGVILADLHEAANKAGRRFPLTLGARGSATVGGLISTNAGGTQVLRFGTMRRLVAGIEAVLPDGTTFAGLSALKKDNRGYDLTQLLIGAEGTLGVITAATLHLAPAIGSRSVAWIGLDSPDAALRVLRRLEQTFGHAVEGFELVPATALDLVLKHIPGSREPLTEPHAWYVLIEAVGSSSVAPCLEEPLQRAMAEGLIENAAIALSEAQADSFWRLRDSIAEAEKNDGPAAKHDVSVPIANVPTFLMESVAEVQARFPGTRVNAFGHLGDGNIHFNVRAPDGSGPEWVEGEGSMITRFVHDLVTSAGGSISAEHGIGQMKRSELARLGCKARLGAMRSIKRALDPLGIMNPGKLVPPAEVTAQLDGSSSN